MPPRGWWVDKYMVKWVYNQAIFDSEQQEKGEERTCDLKAVREVERRSPPS